MKTRTFTKTENDYILTFAKKYKAYQLLGGKCKMCGDDIPWHLCLHHKTDKIYHPHKMFAASFSWNIIEREILKCDLLCHNCHREIHMSEMLNNHHQNKKILLEAIQKFQCEKCGYNKCLNALDFHHKDETLKHFDMGRYTTDNAVGNISLLVEEMNKCDVLCVNCHKDKHFDIEKFNKYHDDIIKRSFEHKEKPKVDIELVMRLYNECHSYKKVMEMTGCSKATICYYNKKIGELP